MQTRGCDLKELLRFAERDEMVSYEECIVAVLPSAARVCGVPCDRTMLYSDVDVNDAR